MNFLAVLDSMKTKKHFSVILALSALGFVLAALWIWMGMGERWGAMPMNEVRMPGVAGTFYPADPAALRGAVRALLGQASIKDIGGAPVALVVPHAGYMYSAAIAAQAFAQVQGRKYKRVVVLAPSHYKAFPFASVFDGAAYATPLGKIPVDKAFAEALVESDPLLKFSSDGHACNSGSCEHALEVELPFLQEALGDFKVVPIMVGDVSYDMERALGVALSKLIKFEGGEPDTLIVASSDLSHYHAYDEAVALDSRVLEAIEAGDFFSLSSNIEERVWEACGGAPVVAAMIAADRLGAHENRILARANSGDVTGDRSRVVGYGAAVFARGKEGPDRASPPFSLSADEQKQLLDLAKRSVESAVRTGKLPPLAETYSPALQMARGAFVTLKEGGNLRGCIGFVTPKASLVETVREVAALAALRDTRFSPVTPEELDRIDYEISVLSPIRRLARLEEVQLGRDGLILRQGSRQGLLLPQVPAEQGWTDTEIFAAQTARKAGLPPDVWKAEDADLFAFSAFVFHAQGRE